MGSPIDVDEIRAIAAENPGVDEALQGIFDRDISELTDEEIAAELAENPGLADTVDAALG